MFMKRYTEQELIEWIKGFETINDMVKANMSMYYAARRKNLMNYFPPKQQTGPKLNRDKKQQTEERKALKRAEMAKKEEERRLKKEEREKLKDKSTPANMYRGIELDNGNIICGRCLEEKTERGKNYRGICKECYLRCMTLRTNGGDTNKWNIRDEYCHTIIRHHEKTFEIGIKVDERTERYLKMIGYDFIFKEPTK